MKGSSVTGGRAEELLVERALRGLDDNEHRELDALGIADDDSYDLAAAALVVATLELEPMPAQLAARIAPPLDARRTLAGVAVDLASRRVVAEAPRPVKRRRSWAAAPWLAAAAGVVIAIGAWWWAGHRDGGVAEVVTPSHAREALLASAGDVTRIAWQPTADPTAHGATGDVVWSATQQQGYMRFVGLAPNDRTQFQYQLWIFDKLRDERFPVDGGVFDVSAAGEVIIPIAAKLRVADATLFAVTIERPGGVVVSKRERIVVTAARKG